MVKVLIATQSRKEKTKLCQYLANDNNLKILESNNEVSALKYYDKIKPDIFILDTNLKNYITILDKLSYSRNEKTNCNTILISSTPNENPKISNVSKLYKTFYQPFEYEDVYDTVEEMSQFTLDKKIDSLFLRTNIPVKSPASEKVRDAIVKCCYHPELTYDIDTLYTLVSEDFKTTKGGIRSSFRTTLKSLNSFKEKDDIPKFSILNFFEKNEDVTPRRFLEVSINYLLNTKNNR